MRTSVLAVFVVLTIHCLAASNPDERSSEGKTTPSDSFSSLVKKARQGDPSVQFNIGLAYETGSGVKQNYAEAAHWYELSADHGEPRAQNNLGTLYLRGW